MSDKFIFNIFCVQFQERIALAIILKRPYFWVQKVVILRWLITDQQVSYLYKVECKPIIKYRKDLPVDEFPDKKNLF